MFRNMVGGIQSFWYKNASQAPINERHKIFAISNANISAKKNTHTQSFLWDLLLGTISIFATLGSEAITA